MSEQVANKDDDRDLAEVLRALIIQTADPSRVLEWHYWAQEPNPRADQYIDRIGPLGTHAALYLAPAE